MQILLTELWQFVHHWTLGKIQCDVITRVLYVTHDITKIIYIFLQNYRIWSVTGHLCEKMFTSLICGSLLHLATEILLF